MSNSWSKEDRYHYNKSEVMQELEKKVMETLNRLDILSKKAEMSPESMKQMADAADATKESVDALKESLNEASDGVADEDEVAGDSFDAHMENENKDAVVNDLRDMVQAALAENNVKLAYKIERTIDEILEQEITCEL
tara:strand:- start:4569 stop:4982 length:414 start_codon:yes stop_codon:yes gene_type:complete